MFNSWVILHSYLINEPLVGFTKITRETFLWETNGQGTRNGGIIKEQLLSDLLQIGQVSGKFVKKIFILLVQCCMQRTTSPTTALMVELLSNHPPSSFILKYPVLPRLSTGSPKIEPYLHRPPTQHVQKESQVFETVWRLPACRRILFPLLHACNKGNRRRLYAGKFDGEYFYSMCQFNS